MYRFTLAGRHRRTWSAVLAAALAAALAAFALPAGAQAATAKVAAGLVLQYTEFPGETNQVRIAVTGNQIVISDTAPITASNGCTLDLVGDARCPFDVDLVNVQLGDGNDRVEYAAPHQAAVVGGRGNDLFLGALRQVGVGRAMEPAFYQGGTGTDTISYRFADRGVVVDSDDFFSTNPAIATDGRPGIDRESVPKDFEIIEGSNFDDPQLFGSTGNDVLRGLNGNDVIGGGEGADIIDEGSTPNGADTINGGIGDDDRVSYGTRTTGGVVVDLNGVRNDGAPGEQDDVRPSVEHIDGTNFRDTLVGNGSANTINGFGDTDTIDGLGGNDTLSAGAGGNNLLGGTGNDIIETRNAVADNIDCGENPGDSDTANRDVSELRVVGCERGATVGVLRLSPKRVRAEAGEPVRLRLSWRHPKAWKQLRRIELRLTRDAMPVGEVRIRPRRDRIAAADAVSLVRRGTRLTRDGKTVIARLALRLHPSLAGQTLEAEVEATDRRGRRQLERHAGTVRISE